MTTTIRCPDDSWRRCGGPAALLASFASGRRRTHYNGLTKMSVGSYSPDDKSIVFGMVVRAVNRPHATLNDVFVMNADGSHVRPVTRNKRWDGSPDWGPRQ